MNEEGIQEIDRNGQQWEDIKERRGSLKHASMVNYRRYKETLGYKLKDLGHTILGNSQEFEKKNSYPASWVLIIAFLGVGIFFLSQNFTGNAILETNSKTTNGFGIILVVVAMIIFLYFKKKKIASKKRSKK